MGEGEGGGGEEEVTSRNNTRISKMTRRSITIWCLGGLPLLVVAGVVTYKAIHPAQPQTMRHHLTGYVLEVRPATNTIAVRNDDMPGVMAPMVMGYRVKDSTAFSGIKAGDVIEATMVNDSYWLEDIRVTGKH